MGDLAYSDSMTRAPGAMGGPPGNRHLAPWAFTDLAKRMRMPALPATVERFNLLAGAGRGDRAYDFARAGHHYRPGPGYAAGMRPTADHRGQPNADQSPPGSRRCCRNCTTS